jgi:hypothetical protein
MPQLSLFSRAELATMRDRDHSLSTDSFRRDQLRRREHGKARRHAARIYQAFQQSCSDEVPRIPPIGTPPGA